MIQPIILAAGMGTRMGSALPKSLHQVAGKPMLLWLLDAFLASGICAAPVLVVGHRAEQVIEAAGPTVKTVLQKEINGSAKAVECALGAVEGEVVLITNADQPFLRPTTVKAMAQAQSATGAPLVMGMVTVDDFAGWRQAFVRFGRIVRTAGEPSAIVEYKNATEAERDIREVNPGVYAVDVAWLRQALPKIQKNELSGEYYVTDIVALAKADGKKVVTVPLSPEEGYGINMPDDLAQAELLSAQMR